MLTDFTPREVAELSGAAKSVIEKAIEEKVLAPRSVMRARRAVRMLSADAVAYAKVVSAVKYRMDLPMKRRLAAKLAKLNSAELRTLRFELEPAVEMDVGRLVGDSMERAERYAATRDRLIVVDEEVLGGAAVIRGTRISVYAVLGRIKDGESIDEVLADYPHLTGEALEAAVIYARSHPLVGRPGGRPWSTAA